MFVKYQLNIFFVNNDQCFQYGSKFVYRASEVKRPERMSEVYLGEYCNSLVHILLVTSSSNGFSAIAGSLLFQPLLILHLNLMYLFNEKRLLGRLNLGRKYFWISFQILENNVLKVYQFKTVSTYFTNL